MTPSTKEFKNKFCKKIKEAVQYNIQHNGRFTRDIEYDIICMKDFRERFPDKKIVIVLYSAGLDSTYLLLKELDKGNYVIPVTNLLNSDDLDFISHYIIQLNIHHLYRTNMNRLIYSVDSQVRNPSSFSYYQQAYNIMSIFVLGYNFLQYVDEVQIGFTLKDEGVSYISELRTLFNTSLKFMPDEETPLKTKLVFPLSRMSKPMIAEKLEKLQKKNNTNLRILSCEKSFSRIENDDKEVVMTIKCCGTCNSCQRNINEGLERYNKDIILRTKIFRKAT